MLTFFHDEFPFELIILFQIFPRISILIILTHTCLSVITIPNLIAKPFDVSHEYAQIIYNQTSLPKLDKVLKKWEQEEWAGAENCHWQKLAYIILVKLLAYQFASPVHWIQTQDLLFTTFNFEHLIELGPSPTLTGMATHTRMKFLMGWSAEIALFSAMPRMSKRSITSMKTRSRLLFLMKLLIFRLLQPLSPPLLLFLHPRLASHKHRGHSVSIKAFDILLVIVAQKLKKRVDEIPLSKLIKDLVGGKSTLQNKILSDLQQEFALALEKGEEHPLEELGSVLGSGFSGALGNYSTGLVSHFIGGKMPGGFNLSAIKSHLSKSWGLGSSRSYGILLLGTTFEPPK